MNHSNSEQKSNRFVRCFAVFVAFCFVFSATTAAAQTSSETASQGLRQALRIYRADDTSLKQKNAIPMSTSQRKRFERFYLQQLEQLNTLEFAQLTQDGKVDFLLFRNLLNKNLSQLNLDLEKDQQIQPLIPFFEEIVRLAEARESGKTINGQESAETLHQIALEITDLTAQINQQSLRSADATGATRASRRVERLRNTLAQWYGFYHGYDPLFTWWVKAPFEKVDRALNEYSNLLRRMSDELSGTNRSRIVGEPIGNAALIKALKFEQIPYTPAELVSIAMREFKWCDAEMNKASRELGFGDDWRAAQDSVKSKFVPPGDQPKLIYELAEEAIQFIEQRELVTIPPLCKETWQMRMMSPQRQKVSPYFLGGQTIQVSYPTDSMDHADKLMSFRGNNPHFSRAVVHHELIPGHYLQQFMQSRHRTYRSLFATPFWLEGWALYWEMRLWDMDFSQSPEDKIGMLFWRKHRCARIIFSLSYHMNEMSADECIDFLVERVGHERNNSTAEVRRSIEGGYGPLYQAAYMLGGLQIRRLHEELVKSGKMSERDFHDAILEQNSIPIELIRARLTNQALTPEFKSNWRFAD